MEIDLHLKFLALKVLALPVAVTSLAFIFLKSRREGEREKGRDRNISWLPPLHSPMGI